MGYERGSKGYGNRCAYRDKATAGTQVQGRAGVVKVCQRGLYALITNAGVLTHPQATLLAIRHTHKQMHAGIRESEARQLVARALADAGLKDGGCLTLFGGMRLNLISPALILSAQKTPLSPTEVAPTAVSAQRFFLVRLYSSLYTATGATSPAHSLFPLIPDTHLQIWNFVHSAQHIAFQTAHAGVVASASTKPRGSSSA